MQALRITHFLFFQHLGVLLQNDPQLVELTLLREDNSDGKLVG